MAFLGCIDIHPCVQEAPFDEIGLVTALAALLELIDWERAKDLDRQLRAHTQPDPCAFVLRFASRERLVELSLDLPQFTAWARVALVVENLMRSHVASGNVRGMTVFQSAGFPAAGMAPEEWRSRIRGWDSFVRQPTRYIEVPGEHYTLMSPQHVAAFQAAFRAEIALALGETEAESPPTLPRDAAGFRIQEM